VSSPRYGWGSVTHSSTGTVVGLSGNTATVDFPEQSGWAAAVSELDVVSCGGCSAGAFAPSGSAGCTDCAAGGRPVAMFGA
jgi:hypothetical protein